MGQCRDFHPEVVGFGRSRRPPGWGSLRQASFIGACANEAPKVCDANFGPRPCFQSPARACSASRPLTQGAQSASYRLMCRGRSPDLRLRRVLFKAPVMCPEAGGWGVCGTVSGMDAAPEPTWTYLRRVPQTLWPPASLAETPPPQKPPQQKRGAEGAPSHPWSAPGAAPQDQTRLAIARANDMVSPLPPRSGVSESLASSVATIASRNVVAFSGRPR